MPFTPQLKETDPRFRLGPSTVPGAGIGVFTVVPLDQGDRFEIIGFWVAAESVADQCTAFANHHKFRVGDELLVPVGFGGMVNDSDTPNLIKEVDEGRIYLRALRRIDIGEELFHTYNAQARSRMGLG